MPRKNYAPRTTTWTFRIPEDLLEELKAKAGMIPLSVIIRRLIEKYIKGEVGLD